MIVAGLLLFFAPLVVLVVAGALSADLGRRDMWTTAAGLVMVSTAVWLVYVGLFPHQTPCNGRATGCPTVYGNAAPLPDEHPTGMALLGAGFLLPAGLVGWRRRVPPATAGAALALGPTLLACWTAPRGDNDGLWTLIFMVLPLLGALAAVVAAVTERIAAALPRSALVQPSPTVASTSDRLAALVVDVTVIGMILVLPLSALSHAKFEIVAGIVGLTASTTYFGAAVAWKGRSIGQSLIGLVVVDAGTDERVSFPRGVLRSLVVFVEVALASTLILAIPAVVELIVLTVSGRTVTDRLLGTVVLSVRRPLAGDSVYEELRISLRCADGQTRSGGVPATHQQYAGRNRESRPRVVDLGRWRGLEQ